MAAVDQQWLVALGLGFILFLGFRGKKSEPEPELDQLKQDAMALINVWNTVVLAILQSTGMKSSLEAWREVDNDKNHEKLMRFTEFCRQWLARGGNRVHQFSVGKGPAGLGSIVKLSGRGSDNELHRARSRPW